MVLATLIVAAHFLRAGQAALGAASVAALGLLFIRRRWVLLVGQGLLFSAAALWVTVAVDLIRMRLVLGDPWIRMAIILGAVPLFTLFAAMMLRTKTLKSRFARESGPNLGKS